MQQNKTKLNFLLFAYWHDPRWKKFVGATVKILDLAQNLYREGHDVTLILPKYKFGKTKNDVKIVELPFLDLPILRSLTFNIYLSIFLLFCIFKKRPDVVYTRRMGSIIPGLYAKLVRAIYYYEINDDPYRKDYHSGSLILFKLRKLLSEWQDKVNLNLCDKSYIITKNIIEKIKKKHPYLPSDKLHKMPSGANIELFKPLDKMQCRLKLKLNSVKSYILFIGTLLKHQGVDILIEAAPTIVQHIPSSIFIIIGEGPMKDIWMKKVRNSGIQEHFLFTGQVEYEKVPIWIGSSDLCVAPFKKNAGLRSPVKIFDYMSCGRPVVASEIKGTTDIFLNSGAILLVEPEEPNFIAHAIIDILNNIEKAKEMAQNGRDLIEEKYDRKILANTISTKAQRLFRKNLSHSSHVAK